MSDETFGADAQEPDDVGRFLIDLRALGDGPAPAPSVAVAALIGGAVPLRRHPLRRAAVRTAVVAAALLAALVGAAANHSLPQPAQRVVSNFVNDLTPFDIGPKEAPATPTEQPTAPARTRTPEREHRGGDDRQGQRGESDRESTVEPTRGGPSSSESESGADGSDDAAAPRTSADEPEQSSSGGERELREP